MPKSTIQGSLLVLTFTCIVLAAAKTFGLIGAFLSSAMFAAALMTTVARDRGSIIATGFILASAMVILFGRTMNSARGIGHADVPFSVVVFDNSTGALLEGVKVQVWEDDQISPGLPGIDQGVAGRTNSMGVVYFNRKFDTYTSSGWLERDVSKICLDRLALSVDCPGYSTLMTRLTDVEKRIHDINSGPLPPITIKLDALPSSN